MGSTAWNSVNCQIQHPRRDRRWSESVGRVSACGTLGSLAAASQGLPFPASADQLAPMPASASFQEAAGLVISAGTAYEGLVDRGRLQAGETVLITAGR